MVGRGAGTPVTYETASSLEFSSSALKLSKSCIFPFPFSEASNVFKALLLLEREIRAMNGSELDD